MSHLKNSRVILTALICGCLMHALDGSGKPNDDSYSQKKAAAKPITCVQANRINIRQIEGKGIGYGQGYTTLEAFLTPYKTFDSWLPFVDIRGHRFDDNKYALNAGLGFRYLTDSNCMIWGVNAYYDYRQTNHKNYKQVGIGLEALGAHWDYRINGYIPVGERKSGFYQTRFDKFKDHNLYVKAKREFDMAGVNVEAAYHWMPKDYIDVTAALGPYYFQGKFNQFAAGGQARVKATFLESISVEGIGSYDNLFKWNGQGQLTFSIPLGPTKLKTRGIANSNCNHKPALDLRVVQPVQRFEIIVADAYKESRIAIDPATGLPYYFVFVNNDPSATPDGSFENPFLTLQDAQAGSAPGNIVYVYAAAAYTAPGTSLITLQDSQLLWGSGIKHHLKTQLGGMNVPAMTSAYPILSNGVAAGSSMIILGNNNEVSGFSFPSVDCTSHTGAIFGSNITGALVQNNIFVLNSSGGGTIAFGMENVNGPIIAMNNTISCIDTFTDFGFIVFNTTATSGSYSFINNTIVGSSGMNSQGINFTTQTTTPVNLVILNNRINQMAGGISVVFQGNISGTVEVSGNTVNNAVGPSLPGINLTLFTPGVMEVAMTNNSVMNCAAGGVLLADGNGTSLSAQINNNFFQGNSINSMTATTDATSSMCLQLNNNAFDLSAILTGNPPGGPLYLETPTGNTGPAPVEMGVTPVPPGTCQ